MQRIRDRKPAVVELVRKYTADMDELLHGLHLDLRRC